MRKFVVDTDLLMGHVLHTKRGTPSDLRQLMGSGFCYTTVFNAAEAFGMCRTEAEREAVEASMQALKVLGLNAKSGKNIGRLLSSFPRKRSLHVLIAGLCLESRLPLVTRRAGTYKGIPGMRTMSPQEALRADGDEGTGNESTIVT